jgi:hypothetical protein
MKLTRQHFEFIADNIAPLLFSPTDVERMADRLEKTNNNFKRGVFVSRCLKNWEERNLKGVDEWA